MNQLIFALKNWQSFDEPAIAGKLKAFEKIPRAEWSKFRADQLSEQETGQSLVHIGQKYHNNPKILRWVTLKSLDIFFREIKQRKRDIPKAYRETIIRFFNDHMNDESLSEYSRNKYKALITQIESIN